MTANNALTPAPQPEIVPNPDPTSRTLEVIEQRIHDLMTLLNIRFENAHDAREAVKETFGVRIVAIENALRVFQESITSVPTDVDKRVGSLKELHEKEFGEKFNGVQLQLDGIQRQFDAILRQFEQQDKRQEQTSREAKEAVATAFTASKEATSVALSAQKELVASQNTANAVAAEKSDKQTRDLLEQLRILQNTTAESLAGQLRTNATNTDGKINDLKDTLALLATQVTAMQSRQVGTTTQQDTSTRFAFAALAALGTLFGIGMAIYAVARQ